MSALHETGPGLSDGSGPLEAPDWSGPGAGGMRAAGACGPPEHAEHAEHPEHPEPSEGSERSEPPSLARGPARALLRGGTPVEVLARLLHGDPLGARQVVRRRLEQRALLLDAERATLRALARCARYGTTLGPRASLGPWLQAQVDTALDELLRSEARGDVAPAEAGSTVFEQLAVPLGIEPGRARAACLAFNHQGSAERRAFHELCLGRVPLDRSARSSGTSVTDQARRARRVLDAVLDACLGGNLEGSQGAQGPSRVGAAGDRPDGAELQPQAGVPGSGSDECPGSGSAHRKEAEDQ